MTKTFIRSALAAVSLAAVAAAGAPAFDAQPGFDTSLSSRGEAQLIQASCYDGERSSDCRERGRAERRGDHHYVWRDGRYQDDSGAAVAGSILGFTLGAAIAGSQDDRGYYNSHRRNREWRDGCRTNYQGWDSRSGTYLGSDGYRHYCTR